MSGLKIKTKNTEAGLTTFISYLKDNEYEVYISLLHPVAPIGWAVALKLLSDKIREKEAK